MLTPLDFLSLIFIPCNSILVRYRAGYYPKPTPVTTPDTDVNAKGDSTISDLPLSVEQAPGVFEVSKRIKEKEGTSGSWKGVLPMLLWNIVLPMFWFYENSIKIWISPAPATLNGSFIFALSYNFFSFVSLVLVYRCIMTTEKLEVFGTSVKSALRALFTEHERKRPWVVVCTPGLIQVLTINIILQTQVFRRLWDLVKLTDVYGIRVTCTISLLILTTAVVAPLDVIITRLVIQRNYGHQTNDTPLETPDVEAQVAKSGGAMSATLDIQPEAEAVVRTRSEPYLGLIDCVKKIVLEEGWTVLYRGWWHTLLGATMAMSHNL